jgi:soluble lytic murein transglycosylase-like protein
MRLIMPIVALAAQAPAGQQTPGEMPPATSLQGGGAPADSICLMIESAAVAHDLPVAFFVRVIWQESRFQPDAVGPPTRNGQRALGIAQFMPGTATERGLLDPLDPVAALPKSAEFLRDLRGEFGNLGLAAAAYNAGPRRVHDWLNGTGPMPAQTRDYVQAITGRDIEDWKRMPAGDLSLGTAATCPALVAQLKLGTTRFVGRLIEKVDTSAAKPWGVELIAGFSRDRIVAAYAAIEAKYRDALAGADAIILRSRLRTRGTRDFYQVRAGAETRTEAEQTCRRLRAAGAACLVLRNSNGTAEPI